MMNMITANKDGFERAARICFLVFCLFMLSLSFAPPSSYAGFVSEDGPVETASAAACFLGAFFCLKSFFLRRKILSRGHFLLVLGAFLFFFVGGEEISWGQRLLGLRPVFAGSELNVQREMNIHNLDSMKYLVYFGGFLFIVIFTGVMPALSYVSGKVKSLYTRMGVPLMPASVCLCMWMGFIALVLVPQIRYGRGELFTVFYPWMYAIEELREFYFALVLTVYVFTDYYRLLLDGRPFDFAPEEETDSAGGGFFASANRGITALVRDNIMTAAVFLTLLFLIVPRIELFKDYRNHADKQIFYRDPDVIVVEGEDVRDSNAGYWFKDRKELFGNRYLSFYEVEPPEQPGYFFFRYEFHVSEPGTYKAYFAGTPPGSLERCAFRHQNHSPYTVVVDGLESRDISLETSDEYSQKLQYRNYGFYLHYEYADDFYITKLGEYRFERGPHSIEFRIDKRSIGTEQYVFYLDAVVFTPEGWRPRKQPGSFATDIFSH